MPLPFLAWGAAALVTSAVVGALASDDKEEKAKERRREREQERQRYLREEEEQFQKKAQLEREYREREEKRRIEEYRKEQERLEEEAKAKKVVEQQEKERKEREEREYQRVILKKKADSKREKIIRKTMLHFENIIDTKSNQFKTKVFNKIDTEKMIQLKKINKSQQFLLNDKEFDKYLNLYIEDK